MEKLKFFSFHHKLYNISNIIRTVFLRKGFICKFTVPVFLMVTFILNIINITSICAQEVEIPAASDWTDRGVILGQSSSGWDKHFGNAPSAVVKKDGTYFLYYVGASGPRSSDGGPKDRALGVATSTDGINFTKYSGNPILTHQPHNNEEEGVWTAAATLDDDGNVVVYYGGLWAANSTTSSVDVHIYLAISSDGLNFTDMGKVYESSANGGENTPYAVIHAQGGTSTGATGSWHVWYGRSVPETLLMGDSVSALSRFGNVLPSMTTWSKMTAVNLGGGKIAIFGSLLPLKVWTANISSLDKYQYVAESSGLSDGTYKGIAVLINRESNTWYMYYRSKGKSNVLDIDEISLKTAPVKYVSSDITPPSTPQSLITNVQSENQIDLTWQAASDSESGISKYNIYRDGSNVGQSTTTSFSDTGLNEGTTYNYEVSAVNGAGMEGPKSAPPVSTNTFADANPPTMSSVSASGDSTVVTIVFSESVEQTSATNASNYQINNGITVSSVFLGSDQKTVTLTTFSHTDGVFYTLTVNNINDRAFIPNVIAANSQATYTFVAQSQLVISNLTVGSGLNYEVVKDGLQTGAVAYIDRNYTYSSIPALIQGATYIKTANNDKASSGTSFLTFDVNQGVTVYVAHDDRKATKPSWMASFTDTGEDIVTNDATFSVFAKDFSTGTVVLGGNEANSMYTVIITGQGTGPNPDTAPPAIPTGLSVQ